MDQWNQDELSRWKASLLKGFLREHFVKPMDLKRAEELSKVFRKRRKTECALGIVTPTDTELRQVAQCYLLSFGHHIRWSAITSHELVRKAFESDSTLFEYINEPAVLLYHGFDSLSNSMTVGMVNQVITGRSFRDRPTLVLMKAKDPEINVTQLSISSVGKMPKQPGKPGSNPNLI
jgi:hypothetical protein